MDALDWLCRWYQAQCDGDWEHSFGPSMTMVENARRPLQGGGAYVFGSAITTIDNPGWSLHIELAGTDCDGRMLDRIEQKLEHETDWWTCWTEANVFHGAGGPLQLRALLETFRDWATSDR